MEELPQFQAHYVAKISTRPGKAAFSTNLACETVHPLICKIRGRHHDDDGFIGLWRAAALERGREGANCRGELCSGL